MKISIPECHDITLNQMQQLDKAGEGLNEYEKALAQGKKLLELFCKVDYKKIGSEKDIIAILLTTLEVIKSTMPKDYPKQIEDYNLVPNLLDIRVGHLIELSNLNVEGYNQMEGLPAAFYRKDWSKPFSIQEYLETAEWFWNKPLSYAVYGSLAAADFSILLKDTYPSLYKKSNSDEEVKDDRKMYNMLYGLSGGDFTKWNDAKNGLVCDAFLFLETKEIDYQKQRKRQGYL